MHASNAFGRGFGERKLSLIMDAFPKIANSATYAPTVDDLVKIEGISSISATAFLAGLEKYRAFQKAAKLHCVPPTASKPVPGSKGTTTKSQLLDQVIVFTGFRNKDWEKAIVEYGGKVGTGVTDKTTMIVVKDASSDSKKIQDARDKGIKILTTQQFEKLLV